jgi:glycerol-3-phosphate acyltransferase PlsY
MFSLFVILILSYLAGSIPTAILVSKIVMKDDIRKYGSKNAGATNVFRVMGWKPALFVVLVDIGKGMVASFIFSRIVIDPVPLDATLIRILAGVAAIVGHVWTVFAGFKGGKGVGTAFGVLVGIAPVPVLITAAVWLILVFTTRIVSVGSLAAALVFPTALLLQRIFFRSDIPVYLLYFSLGLAVLIILTHRTNIRRLLKGEENRFGSKTKPSENH